MQKPIRYPTSLLSITALTLAGASVLFLRASSQTQHHTVLAAAGEYRPEVKIEIQNGYRTITSNGIPDHATGAFPNPGNPNSIAPQNYHYRVTMTPKLTGTDTPSRLFGVAINGIPFDPATAELWHNNPQWSYEALSGMLFSRGGLGVDSNLAHVQPNGAYHYHGLPMGLLKRLDYTHRMALIGYAVDGFPVYGPNAYTNADDPHSPLKQLKSSYRLKDGMRPSGPDSPGGAYDGSFASDYEYVKGAGDLDTTNGRTGVTPEYPQGTYYYVVTANWPFLPRKVKGTPDASFFRPGPGGGGPGGPGGFGQGPGGRGQGFGGPGQGPGGPGQGPGGFPGGPGGGQRGPGGMPGGFVPASALGSYLGLTAVQREKLEALVKTVDALNRENFAIPAYDELKLADDQIRKIAAGAKLADVLSTAQKKVLAERKRPAFPGQGGPGGPGGQGGFGGPGGPGQGGPGGFGGRGQGGPGQGGPDGPPPGE